MLIGERQSLAWKGEPISLSDDEPGREGGSKENRKKETATIDRARRQLSGKKITVSTLIRKHGIDKVKQAFTVTKKT